MSGLAAGAAVSSTTKLALLAPPWGGGGGAGAVGCVALPRGVCRRGGWVRGGLWGALCRLWAGGGADVAAASAFLATVTMSAVAAGVAPFYRHPVGVVSVSAAMEVTVSRMLRQLPLLRFLLDRPGYRGV